jgi:hypothetical protein
LLELHKNWTMKLVFWEIQNPKANFEKAFLKIELGSLDRKVDFSKPK